MPRTHLQPGLASSSWNPLGDVHRKGVLCAWLGGEGLPAARAQTGRGRRAPPELRGTLGRGAALPPQRVLPAGGCNRNAQRSPGGVKSTRHPGRVRVTGTGGPSHLTRPPARGRRSNTRTKCCGGAGCTNQGCSPAPRCCVFIRLICHLQLNSGRWVSGRGCVCDPRVPASQPRCRNPVFVDIF